VIFNAERFSNIGQSAVLRLNQNIIPVQLQTLAWNVTPGIKDVTLWQRPIVVVVAAVKDSGDELGGFQCHVRIISYPERFVKKKMQLFCHSGNKHRIGRCSNLCDRKPLHRIPERSVIDRILPNRGSRVSQL